MSLLTVQEVLKRPIRDLCDKISPAIHCAPDTTLREALTTLRQSEIGSVVVTADNKVVGILTERDFMMKLADSGLDFGRELVSRHMTKSPVCIKNTDSLASVLKEMRKGNFRHLIVVDSYQNIQSVLSIKDIAKYLIDILEQMSAQKQAA